MKPIHRRAAPGAWWRRILNRNPVAPPRLRARVPFTYVRRSDPRSDPNGPARRRQATYRQPAATAAGWNIHVHLTWPLSSVRVPASRPGEPGATTVRPALHQSVSLWQTVLDRVERAWSGVRTVAHIAAAQKAGSSPRPTALTTRRLRDAASASTVSAISPQSTIVYVRQQAGTSLRSAHDTPVLQAFMMAKTAMRAPIAMRTSGSRHDARSVMAVRQLVSVPGERTRTDSRTEPAMATLARTHLALLREATQRASQSLMTATDRAPLYPQPVPRSFAAPPRQAPAAPTVVAPPVMPSPAPAPPTIDVGRLTEDVYHHLQRRIRIERERRGL
jgi:hypothetical protein